MSLVDGTFNFRDTGGLPAGSLTTRAGVLYRSGNLAAVTAEGSEQLAALALKRIIDLRDDDEFTTAPSRAGGVPISRVPLFMGSVASFFENDMDLAQMYAHLVDESAPRVLEVVRGVISDQPVLVHCTVGKDRTGVTVALTLAAAGVDEDAIVSDYARTQHLLPQERNRMVVERIRAVHPDAKNAVELATLSPAPVMRNLLRDLTARFGSPTEYLRANGLGDDEIRELRRVLVQSDTFTV